MGTLNNKTWTKTNNYYNKDVVKCDVYSKKFGRGVVYIQDSKEKHFMHTFSFGANSDYSHGGSFYNCDSINTILDAQNALDKIVPLQLQDKDEEARDYINSL